jgi:hypothetical protein
MNLFRGILNGAAAGAAGTTALNTATYLDMAIRGRPASSTPEETVKKLAETTGVTIPGDDKTRSNRIAGLGPLTGLMMGVGVGAGLGLARAAGGSAGWKAGGLATGLALTGAALVGGNGPMTALGVTDPRSWTLKEWMTDIMPHLAYGAVATCTLLALDRPRSASR